MPPLQNPRSFWLGELQHRMDLVAPAGVLDDAEVEIETSVPTKIAVWPPQFQVSERLQAGGLNTQTYYTVTCQYRTDVKPDLVWRERCHTERTFQILSIVPTDRSDALDMRCVTSG